MSKSTSLSDMIDTVWGKGAPLTWDATDLTVDLVGLQDDAEMLAAARYALRVWNAATGFTFTEVTGTADITFDNESQGAYAQSSYYIDGNHRAFFEVLINVAKDFQNGFPVGQRWGVGDYGVQTFIHEIGHALGLRHPGDYNAGSSSGPITYGGNATYAMDTYQYSVMSYFNQSNYGDADRLFVATPMLVDFAALEALYGPLEGNLGNTTYGASGLYDFSIDAAFTISDAGGTDVIDIGAQTRSARIDLGAGAFSDINGHTKNVGIALGTIIENAAGGSAGDTIVGNTVANQLSGRGGDDDLAGGDGDDTLDGGAGLDTLTGGRGDDTCIVDNAGDRIVETAGGGTDRVYARTSYELAAGQDIETLATISNKNTRAIDLIGNDKIQIIYGNAGANVLDGKGGADALQGLSGADTFAFSTALGADNVDRIADFASEDTIRLSKSVFAALGLGTLDADAFKDLNLAGARIDADDHIFYDGKGRLFYDADGAGGSDAVLFARLSYKPALSADDFLIV